MFRRISFFIYFTLLLGAKMKYVLYLRVSTQDQDERTQEARCLDYLKRTLNDNFQYIVFIDKLSSRLPPLKRLGLVDALDALEPDDVFVATRLDRIARNLYETTCIVEELDCRGAEFILVDQPGIKNKILLGLYAGMAEEEVKLIRRRIKDKLDAKKNRGERISRHLPYGYRLCADKLHIKPDPTEQLVIAKILQFRDQGVTFRELGSVLAREGHLNRVGKPFDHASLAQLVRKLKSTRQKDLALAV